MPNTGRHPCGSCGYVAASKRMLSRHTAIAHASQPFRCPLCPFVSCYQANLYRHKRDIHGLGQLSACEICGFFASSIEDLIQHKENNHQDQIEWLRKKYANERIRLGVENKDDIETKIDDIEIKSDNDSLKSQSMEHDESDKNEISKEESSLLQDYNVSDEVDVNISDNVSDVNDTGNKHLGSLKIKRSYACEECGLTTINPRQYLYHRRDIHGEKMTIHECQYCIYASKHVQKLQRHCALIHYRAALSNEDNSSKQLQETTATASNTDITEISSFISSPNDLINSSCLEEMPKKQYTARKTITKMLKCSECSFQTRNDELLQEHEKDAHKKRKFFYNCLQCGYGTNNKSRFTRHLKYHSLPKTKCDFCDFKSAYKWNMDRHMKNHMELGEFACNKCSFTTNTKQSLTVHKDYHHGNNSSIKSRKTLKMHARKGLNWKIVHDDESQFHPNNIHTVNQSSICENSDEYLFNNEDEAPSEEEMYRCMLCTFETTSEDILIKHKMKHRKGETMKKHSCPICYDKFTELFLLGQHLKVEHSEDNEAHNIAAVVDMLTTSKANNEISKSNPVVPSSTLELPEPIWENKERKKTRSIPTCNICGYKTRWVSELIKHKRVHSGEKPFECRLCDYKCRWKGDLTRHLQKFHNQETPTKVKFNSVKNTSTPCHQVKDSHAEHDNSFPKASLTDSQDAPLDLTTNKNSFQLVDLSHVQKDANDCQEQLTPTEKIIQEKEVFPVKRKLSTGASLIVHPPKVTIKKYKCTYCGFMTRTASRFHVHIVQHFNKRPFVCSACGYRSNWQWDITKHIRMKSIRDDTHIDATVLITDETGRKNYDKYKPYLVDVEEKKIMKKTIGNGNKRFKHDSEDDDTASPVADEPENIVVTPDLPFTVEDSSTGHKQMLSNRLFYCKHCPFRNQDKKLVISHLAIHAGIKLFHCVLCGLSSNWRHVVLRHVRMHHNGSMEHVEDCVTFTVQNNVIGITGVKKHVSGDSSISNYKKIIHCEVCPYTCEKEAHMKFHMKQHQPKPDADFKCSFCPYYVKNQKSLIQHLELHKHTDLENKSVAQPDEYCDDNYIAEAKNQINCRKQSDFKTYAHQPLLREKRHECEHCPYKTNNKTQYLYHKQFHRPNKAAKYKCKLCSYWATHQHLMSQHLKVHDIIQPYTLVGPESQFVPLGKPSQEILENPVVSDDIFLSEQTHMTENQNNNVTGLHQENQIQSVIVQKGEFYFRMYKCSYCPMMNKRRANVRIHERMHSKSKISKYSCPICNYRCNNQGIISAHMKIHGKSISDSIVTDYNNENVENNITRFFTENETLLNKRKKVFSYFCIKCPAVFKSSADMQIHKTFHGASYSHPCPHCDYKAKHKPHLHKHLLVHTPEYVAKREASYGPPCMTSTPDVGVVKSNETNQMLLLEEAEMKAVIAGNNIMQSPQKFYSCSLCPAAFFKNTTLQFHLSLHNSYGTYPCSHCSYAVDSRTNLITHEKLHSKKPKIKQPTVTSYICCPKCPGIFNKMDRFNKHVALHGQNNKFTCEHCDYSVPIPANLFNHKVVHTKAYAERKLRYDLTYVSADSTFPITEASLDHSKSDSIYTEKNEEPLFRCQRCPYYNPRKEAIQNHQKHHGSKEGTKCSYCDFYSSRPSFMRDHIKVHFQSDGPLQVQAFMKCRELEVWCIDNENRELIFKDGGTSKLAKNRFLPSLDKELETLYAKEGERLDALYLDSVNVPNSSTKNLSDVQSEVFSSDMIASPSHDNFLDDKIGLDKVIKQSKELEVVLTDVFTDEKKIALKDIISNSCYNFNPDISSEGECPRKSDDYVGQEECGCSAKLASVVVGERDSLQENLTQDNNAEYSDKFKAVECTKEYFNNHDDKDAFEETELQCEVIENELLNSNNVNIFVVKNECETTEESFQVSSIDSGMYYTVEDDIYLGTNNNGFSANVTDNEGLNANYFDGDNSEKSAAMVDSSINDIEWKPDENNKSDVITDIMITNGCDVVEEAEIEVTTVCDDLLPSGIAENEFLDSSVLDKCQENELMSENDGVLPEISMQM